MKSSILALIMLFIFGAASAQINVRQAYSSYGDVIYNYEGKNVRKGSSSFGDIIYKIDGKLPIVILIYIIE